MEIPNYSPPHRALNGPPEIYVHGSNPPDRYMCFTRSDSFSSRFSQNPSSNPMSIRNAREPSSLPPPPLPPPKYPELDTAGDVRHPDIAWQWSNSREDSNWGRPSPVSPGSSLYGSFASRGKSLLEGRPDMERRSSSGSTVKSINGVEARREAPSRNDEGYASLSTVSSGSSLSRFEVAYVNRSPFQSSVHEKYKTNAQAYDKSLLQKLDSRRNTDDVTPSHIYQRPTFSSSLNDTAPTSRIAQEHRHQHHPFSLSMPVVIGGKPSSESPLSTWGDGGLSAISPHSHYSKGHYSFRSPDREELEKSPQPLFRRSPSESLSISDQSVRDGHDYVSVDADSDFPSEETNGLRRLRIDDVAARQDGLSPIISAGQKRRASSPPNDDTPPSLHTVGSAGDLFRRRESAARASVVGMHSHHGSVSSTASGPRTNSYASTLSLTASSVTTVSSIGRPSPGGLSPGGLSPGSVEGSDSPYAKSISLTVSPRISSASSPRQRNALEVRPLITSAKFTDTVTRPAKQTGLSKTHGLFVCECCPKKPKKFETQEDISAHEMEKQYECAYCKNRFKNKNEAERHQSSIHLRRHSWSCATLSGYSAAFHPSPSRPTEADTCGYCGDEFIRTGPTGVEGKLPSDRDWEHRIQHLIDIHKFGECNHAKKFFRADHFRQHLKHSHSGSSGKWTNVLENACMKEEPMPKPRADRIAEENEN